MHKLGGSMFIRNGIEFDFPISEALDSLCAVCDEAVILDCGSTDGTIDLLKEVQNRNPNLKIIQGGNWECAPNYDRLRILADTASSYLKNMDYLFMLQADEVIHESSFHNIHTAIKNNQKKSFMIRRCNLFGDLNHMFKFDIAESDKPCSDKVIRISAYDIDNNGNKIHPKASGDAESLGVNPAFLVNLTEEIMIYHYSYCRKHTEHLNKTIQMQSWFWGPNSQPDSRVVEMAKTTGIYDWQKMKSRDMLCSIPLPHPKFSQKWVEERQNLFIPVE